MIKSIAPILTSIGISLLLPTAAHSQTTPPPTPMTATIHTGDVRQPIYGFGASLTYSGDALAGFSNRETVYKELFSDLGLDILRLRNYSGIPGQQGNFDKITKEYASAAIRYSTPQLRNGKMPVRIMFTSWSPPPALKSNNSESGSGNATLAKDANGHYVYGAFADWWLSGIQNFKADTGVYPDYIALQNELDFPASYQGCVFLGSEGTNAAGNQLAGYDKALAAVSSKLTSSLGASAPKIVGPETFSISTSTNDYNHVKALVDPGTVSGKKDLSELFGVSYHLYGAGYDRDKPDLARLRSNLASLPPLYHANSVYKPMFETEYLEGENLPAVASLIHDAITYGEASSYLVWIAARSEPGSSSPNNYALVYYDPATGLVERRDRFYAMKAYSAYVGEGWKRVGADTTDTDVEISAFISADSKQIVTVLVNPTMDNHTILLSTDSKSDTSDTTDIHRSSMGDSGDHWTSIGSLDSNGTVKLTPGSVVTVRMVRP